MNAATARRVLSAASAFAVAGAVALFNRLVVRSGPAADGLLILSASVAIAGVAGVGAGWPDRRGRVVVPAAVAALVSLAATLVHTPREAPQDAFWILTETLALQTLLALVARWATVRGALTAGSLTAAAAMATMWRITVPSSPPDSREVLGAILTWSFGVVLAAGLGIYLRTLDARRSRSVVEARRAQRMEIARDLHDFVAHDVTGMVVQAQAANVVADRDPREAIAALGRIEEAGLRALGSLDHTVRMLGDLAVARKGWGAVADDGSAVVLSARQFSLEDLLGLVGRFTTTDLRPIRLRVDTGAEPRIPREVVSIAYRVLLEALTNVRRHAPASAGVDVHVLVSERATGATLAVHVMNDAATEDEPALSTPLRGDGALGGRGLEQLAECVADLGGSFAAGPVDVAGASGWHVSAVLPYGGQFRA